MNAAKLSSRKYSTVPVQPGQKGIHDLNPKAEGHWYYENILNLHEKKQNENPEYGFNYGISQLPIT